MTRNEKMGLSVGLGISAIAVASVLTIRDYKNSEWECNECGEKFKSTFMNYCLAPHTLKKRKLECPFCGNKGYFKVVRD